MTNSTTETVYRRLDAKKKEIRLLRVLPQTKDSQVVHCHLETHSLKDLSLDFEQFRSSNTSHRLDKEEFGQKWTEERLSHRLAHSSALKRINSTQPSSILHRYSWGDFATLSYAWGDRKGLRQIVLNGQKTMVTSNLYLALAEFRDAGEFNGRFRLWVDALCINQNDLAERARQIKFMRVIYSSAWTVIAWLGPEHQRSSAAIQLIRDLAFFQEEGYVDEIEARLGADPQFVGSRNWLALQELMERPYWHRLWIIQEICMGSTSTWLRCGNILIDWPTFCKGVAVLQEHLWLIKDSCLEQDVITSKVDVASVWRTTSLHLVYQDMSMLSRGGNTELSLGRLLDLANSADCTDMRDKVYALAGLMPPSVAKLLRPDYAQAEAAVYTAATRAFVQVYDNLDPIREGNPWGPANAPSWVADWQWRGRIRWSRNEHPVWGPAYLGLRRAEKSKHTPYQASGNTKHNPVFSDDGRFLKCTGIVVDSVSSLSARGVGFFDWSRDSIVKAKNWRSIYGDQTATAEAVYRTLVCDRVAGGDRASARHSAIFHLPSTFARAGPQFALRGWRFLGSLEGYYFRWECFRTANRNFPLGPYLFDDFFDDAIPQDASEFDYTEVYSCFDRSSKKRRLMLTEKGYMGWAPDNIYGRDAEQTERGDLIAVVLGCSTPLAIRRRGDKYQVLGEAYVQGLMDGEAIEALREGKYQTEELVFC
ncbi:heterokaryon incompatibility protein-domain-containing protein [Lophiotrema nucula]|uniref:Heterokaryon incompatibility protein-domain-containing protein n=1 Tax=Lophiotrema nucula TaxID=690887 RepID=A0A6A5Z5F7_9PLEO|nr:heterokaryon incompatibility protein-domain-containing protein [Lophiotrema nucula]